ncbi:MAG TPA: hypothetical protein VFE62_00280 [Gemmataceae bacterium]|nr:hypothetical protein [Terracidiphilus sp.]HZZ76918.1 hypothetical protein [Gemmataceae bacterium]
MSHTPERDRAIPCISDAVAFEANCDAIDQLVGECRYPYIVAWGKFLGFTPETVREHVQNAEVDDAPMDAIQKCDGEWLLLSTIKNDTNRKRVVELSRDSAVP